VVSMQDFRYQLGEDPHRRKTHQTWYRGEHCNFIPSKVNLEESDAIDRYVLSGWLPAAPFIDQRTCVTAFGSCFAQHISRFLSDREYMAGNALMGQDIGQDFQDAHVIEFGEGIVNTFALLQQFEWAFENRQFSENLWHGSAGQLAAYDSEIRETTRRLFEKTDVFIITLGLSEVWYNKQSGEVFWRAIPQEQFDESIHGFKVATFQENLDNLERLRSIVRAHKPNASLIFTLSPIPLVATFRPVSCITANSASKAILRPVLDEFFRRYEDDRNLYYWPAYELITNYFQNPYLEDNRHVAPQILNAVMAKFAEHYLIDSGHQASLAEVPTDKSSLVQMYRVPRRFVRYLSNRLKFKRARQ